MQRTTVETQPVISAANQKQSKHHHTHNEASSGKRLMIALSICLVFMVGEIIGGIISKSIAILSDSAHMFSDSFGLFLSLIFAYLSRRPAKGNHTFGYYRAGVIGALANVAILWIFTGILVYLAILRIFEPEPVDGKIMFITGIVGLLANVIMLFVLKGEHPHPHPHPHSHSHSHSHKRKSSNSDCQNENPSHSHDKYKIKSEDNSLINKQPARKKDENMRAAILHVLGDALQSVGVVIASILIWIWPEKLAIADPICTFIFSAIVLFTTRPVIKDCLQVLMEASPQKMDVVVLTEEFMKISGVKEIHDLHVWALNSQKLSLTAHIVTSTFSHKILKEALDLSTSLGIPHATFQIESIIDEEDPFYIRCNHYVH